MEAAAMGVARPGFPFQLTPTISLNKQTKYKNKNTYKTTTKNMLVNKICN